MKYCKLQGQEEWGTKKGRERAKRTQEAKEKRKYDESGEVRGSITIVMATMASTSPYFSKTLCLSHFPRFLFLSPFHFFSLFLSFSLSLYLHLSFRSNNFWISCVLCGYLDYRKFLSDLHIHIHMYMCIYVYMYVVYIYTI